MHSFSLPFQRCLLFDIIIIYALHLACIIGFTRLLSHFQRLHQLPYQLNTSVTVERYTRQQGASLTGGQLGVIQVGNARQNFTYSKPKQNLIYRFRLVALNYPH